MRTLAERGGPHVSNDICLESSKAGFKYFRFKLTFVSIVHTEKAISQIHLRLPPNNVVTPGSLLCNCVIANVGVLRIIQGFFFLFS